MSLQGQSGLDVRLAKRLVRCATAADSAAPDFAISVPHGTQAATRTREECCNDEVLPWLTLSATLHHKSTLQFDKVWLCKRRMRILLLLTHVCS
eukprot:3699236-Amphidinium_carterae.2